MVAKLESLSGYNGEDVRLLASAKQAVAAKIASLGLDGYDTTSHELFHALQVKLDKDSQHLAQALGFKSSEQVDSQTQRLINFISYASRDEVLALKPAVIKDILRHSPPKRLMKRLHYRSLESMLKHESASQLFTGARALESGLWHRDAAKALALVGRADFETRQVEFLAMPAARWGQSASETVVISSITGSVAIWTGEAYRQSLLNAILAVEAAELLEADSYYLKANQFRPDFGRLVAKLGLEGQREALNLAGSSIFNWGNLKHAIDKAAGPLKSLAAISPALAWWADGGHLLHGHSQAVSLHLADNVKSGQGFDSRSLEHARNCLKSELLAGYAQHTGVKQYLHDQIDETFITMEPAEPALAITS